MGVPIELWWPGTSYATNGRPRPSSGALDWNFHAQLWETPRRIDNCDKFFVTLNLTALCYLRAWENDLAITDGLARRDQLQALGLDYSLASLARIDGWLTGARTSSPFSFDQLLADRGLQNTLHLLAFYAGEVVARALGRHPEWHDAAAEVMRDEDPLRLLRGFRASAVCHYAGAGTDGEWFAPLEPIIDRLFANTGDASLAGLAAGLVAGHATQLRPDQPLPALPDPGWPIGLSGQMPRLEEHELQALIPRTPVWVSFHDDPLGYLYANAETLLRGRRVVWAAVVQANNDLFKPKFIFAAPGDVVYDPAGRADGRQLHEVARLLAQQKSGEPTDPDLARYARHLRAETTRVFGEDVSSSVLPYPLKVSTTSFDQLQLPDGMLSMATLPVLIDERCPGAVLPLPQSLWPEALREDWLAAGERRHGFRFDPRAAHRELVKEAERQREADSWPDPATQLYEEGLLHFHGRRGLARDLTRARECWEAAAKIGEGHPLAINNLALIYGEGLGVPVDTARELQLLTRIAQRGVAIGQLNLGKFHLRAEAYAQARIWLRRAADQGEVEALDLLNTYSRAMSKSNGGGVLSRLFSLIRR